jgi:hypothetical protein
MLFKKNFCPFWDLKTSSVVSFFIRLALHIPAFILPWSFTSKPTTVLTHDLLMNVCHSLEMSPDHFLCSVSCLFIVPMLIVPINYLYNN